MSDPKVDCEALLNSVLPFAVEMLSAHGEFFPFGQAMRSDGQIVAATSYAGEDHPKSNDSIALIRQGFVAAARNGDYRATAIAYAVGIRLPPDGAASDAVAVSLDHRNGYTVVVYVPYKFEGGAVTLGTTLAEEGEASVFPDR